MSSQELPELSALRALSDRLAASSDRRTLVIGAVGTGRTTLAQWLSDRLPNAIQVHLPPEGLDRPLHLLAQLGARQPGRLRDILGGKQPYEQRLRSKGIETSTRSLNKLCPRKTSSTRTAIRMSGWCAGSTEK